MPASPEEIRSFIAIELPPKAKQGLAKLRTALEKNEQKFVKWVDPAGIHLTLKFLGNIPFKQVAEISKAIEDAASGVLTFSLEISGIGVFPNPKQPRVFWVGIGGELDKLSVLQQNIDSTLASLGFAREERPFMPHLTLARVRQGTSLEERRTFGEFVTSTTFEDSYHIEVEALNLMKSQLTPAGAIYTRLSEIRLGH